MIFKNDIIEVKVRGFGILKALITDASIKIKKGSLVIDLLTIMLEKYGVDFKEFIMDFESKRISSAVSISKNGKIVNNLEDKIEDGDEMILFIHLSGGESILRSLS
jgi:molybdopterin converting factor small subunit